jgi:hypothetical protein
MDLNTLAGAWAGTASNNTGFELDLTVKLVGPFEAGATVGTFDIPANPCAGTFRLLAIQGQTLVLRAENKQGDCGAGEVADSLEALPDGTLLYVARGEGWEARGVLRRTETNPPRRS